MDGKYDVVTVNYSWEYDDEYGTIGFDGTLYICSGDEIVDISFFDDPGNRPQEYNYSRDIIVLDKRTGKNPNMIVYNSYKVYNTAQRNAIISALLDYERSSPRNWRRTRASLQTEWVSHIIFAPFSTRAKHVDFDNEEEGKGFLYFVWKAVKGLFESCD